MIDRADYSFHVIYEYEPAANGLSLPPSLSLSLLSVSLLNRIATLSFHPSFSFMLCFRISRPRGIAPFAANISRHAGWKRSSAGFPTRASPTRAPLSIFKCCTRVTRTLARFTIPRVRRARAIFRIDSRNVWRTICTLSISGWTWFLVWRTFVRKWRPKTLGNCV